MKTLNIFKQCCINSFRVPADIGRIPHKISTSFASFTADQWKNWTIYFSMIVLRDIVSSEVLECWRHFVLACRILCHYKISEEQLKLGDALLLQFCRRTERLFGKSCITPNMYMHAHLCACTEDYGPLHGYWLFPFERYNGILGSMPNNNKSIENQLMSRFIREGNIISAQLPDEYSNEFTPILPSSCSIGSVSDTLSLSSVPSVNTSWVMDSSIHVPNYSSRCMLDPTEKNHLVELYSDLHKVSRSTIEISSVCMKYLHITMHGKQLGSHNSRMASSSVVLATWDNELFGFLSSPHRLFLQAQCCQQMTHLLVNLSYLKYHPKNMAFGKPITVWYHDLFEDCGIHSLIPVQFIRSRSASLIDNLDDESVLFVVEIIDF